MGVARGMLLILVGKMFDQEFRFRLSALIHITCLEVQPQ